MINNFHGDYNFLSNFYTTPIEYEGIVYSSVEQAYQSQKFINHPDIQEKILNCTTPGKAKQEANRHKALKRRDWHEVNLELMYQLVKQKFSDPELGNMLLATGTEELIEGNWWGDTFWGVYKGKGENHLGDILMTVRGEKW